MAHKVMEYLCRVQCVAERGVAMVARRCGYL